MGLDWNFLTTLLVVALAIVVLGLVSGLWRRWEERRQRKKMELAAAELGLEPVAKAVPELTERFSRLRRQRFQPPRIGLAWKREEPEGRFYVLRLWVDTANEGYQLAGNCVLVISPGLDLPRFGVLTKVEPQGLIRGVARRLQEWTVDRLGRVPIPSNSDFDRKCHVIGEDSESIQAFLSEPRLHELARLPLRGLEAERDMFCYSRHNVSARQNARYVDLRELLEEARLLCRVFQRGG